MRRLGTNSLNLPCSLVDHICLVIFYDNDGDKQNRICNWSCLNAHLGLSCGKQDDLCHCFSGSVLYVAVYLLADAEEEYPGRGKCCRAVAQKSQVYSVIGYIVPVHLCGVCGTHSVNVGGATHGVGAQSHAVGNAILLHDEQC